MNKNNKKDRKIEYTWTGLIINELRKYIFCLLIPKNRKK